MLNLVRRPAPTLFLILLLLGAFVAASAHVVSASPGHEAEHCVVCSWFHCQGWAVSGLLVLFYLTVQRFQIRCAYRFASPFFLTPPGRSPPRR